MLFMTRRGRSLTRCWPALLSTTSRPFRKSYPRPDLTHLPAQIVYECGELWALAPGCSASGAACGLHSGGDLQGSGSTGLPDAQAARSYVFLQDLLASRKANPVALYENARRRRNMGADDGTRGAGARDDSKRRDRAQFRVLRRPNFAIPQSVPDRAEDQQKNPTAGYRPEGSSRRPRRAAPPVAIGRVLSLAARQCARGPVFSVIVLKFSQAMVPTAQTGAGCLPRTA
jgi:hypothetical protein